MRMTEQRVLHCSRLLAWSALACLAMPGGVTAQLLEDTPPELDGVGITEHLDASLPLDLTFLDEDGNVVALGEYFRDGTPVLLNFVYFDCPMLCNVLLDGFLAGLRDLEWTAGDEFEIVTISIDPKDTPEGATIKRDHYVKRLERPEAAAGWHFLTGTQENITEITDAVGFEYRLDEASREYMHAAAVYVATPEGRLARYLYGVMFEPQTLRLSLVEASSGKIGSTLDQLLLFCFAYDHTAGRYGPAAMKLMRVFAAIMVVAVGTFMATHWKREEHRRSVSLGAPD